MPVRISDPGDVCPRMPVLISTKTYLGNKLLADMWPNVLIGGSGRWDCSTHDRGNTAGASGEIHRSLGPGAAGHVVPRAYPNPVAAAGPQCDPTAVSEPPEADEALWTSPPPRVLA